MMSHKVTTELNSRFGNQNPVLKLFLLVLKNSIFLSNW